MASTVHPTAPADWSTAPGALRIVSDQYRPRASRLGVISRSACRRQAQWLKIVRAERLALGAQARSPGSARVATPRRGTEQRPVLGSSAGISRTPPLSGTKNSVSRPLADGTLTRRGFLMINSALFGAIAAAGPGAPPPDLPLPYFGKFYGNHVVYCNPNNRELNKTSVGVFFRAPKSGTVDRFRWNPTYQQRRRRRLLGRQRRHLHVPDLAGERHHQAADYHRIPVLALDRLPTRERPGHAEQPGQGGRQPGVASDGVR